MTKTRHVRIHHAHITVPTSRLEEARRLYLDVLGLEEKPKPAESLKAYPGFWVKTAGPDLHIGGEETGVDRWQSGAHVALEVDSVEELEELRTKLIAAGCTTSEMVDYPGWRRFEWRDLYGNRMEFITPAPSHAPVEAGR